jgi:hypothetical protein
MHGGMITGEGPFTIHTVADADGRFTLVTSDWPADITATSPDSKRRGSANLAMSTTSGYYSGAMRPNQALERTADRREDLLSMPSTLALVSLDRRPHAQPEREGLCHNDIHISRELMRNSFPLQTIRRKITLAMP